MSTVKIDQVTDADLLASLRSTTCPLCGGGKKIRQTLCYGDYMELPREIRNTLYHLLGDGYKQAVQNAFKYNEIADFTLPPRGNDQPVPKSTRSQP